MLPSEAAFHGAEDLGSDPKAPPGRATTAPRGRFGTVGRTSNTGVGLKPDGSSARVKQNQE